MKQLYSLLLAFLMIFAVSSKANAQQIFVRFFDIAGESEDDAHQGWSDVIAYSHTLSNPATIDHDGGAAGIPIHSPIQLIMEVDASTIGLIKALDEGKLVQDATIEWVKLVAGLPVVFYEVKLESVFIVGSHISGAAGSGLPAQEIQLLYEKIETSYTPFDADGNAGASIKHRYDLTGSTLAAEMVALNVRTDGSDVIFQWQTLSESGNFGFEIQHQEDGTYKRAAYVPAAGWSSQRLEYQVRVRGLEEGIHVFRVASLGIAGGISYSQEITVSLGVPEGLTLALDAPFPNPFTDRINLAVSIKRDEEARVSVLDLLGREVALVYEGPLQSGVKSRFVFEPGTALPAGHYLVRVNTEHGVSSRMVTLVR